MRMTNAWSVRYRFELMWVGLVLEWGRLKLARKVTTTKSRLFPIRSIRSLVEAKLAKMAPPAYIISRVADPIFALFIGISAAALRINREEKALGRTTQETIDALRR
jgi:L-cystine uptake protein TcyP (sodium:dicarboxylate symporter family)